MKKKCKALFLATILGLIFTPAAYAQASVGINLDLNQLLDKIEAAIKSAGDSNKVRDTRDAIILFEGKNCSQQLVGSLPLANFDVNLKGLGQWFDNDEARSLAIRSDQGAYNLPVKSRTKILLYDNPDGKTNDDWLEIVVKKQPKGIYPGDAYCISTLEKSYEDDYVKVVYNRDNGLNGKVSHAKVRLP